MGIHHSAGISDDHVKMHHWKVGYLNLSKITYDTVCCISGYSETFDSLFKHEIAEFDNEQEQDSISRVWMG